MSIFVVIAEKPSAALDKRIVELYQDNFYKISDTQWLVSAGTTANSLAELLGVRSADYGRAVVVETTGSAAGFHAKTLWEWLNSKGGVS